MKIQILIASILLASISAQAATKTQAQLILPISGDSGTSIQDANKELAKRNLPLLPESVIFTSDMTQKEIYQIKTDLDERLNQVSPYEALETKAAYGQEVDGRYACFEGDNKQVIRIYEAMIDTFLSEQFGIIAVAVKNPNRFGIKYDESDSGSAGTWINIRRCPTK